MQNAKSVEAGHIIEQKKGEKKFAPTDDSISENSRIGLLSELASFGFNVDQYSECTIEQLQDLVKGAKWLHRTYENEPDPDKHGKRAIRPRNFENRREGIACFTEVDKKVLKSLLDSSGRVSSLYLSRKLEIPLTTVQRRRKRLEGEFLEVSYSLRLDKLGWRRADLLVSTHGKTSAVGKELLTNNTILRVSKSIGEHTIDLHAETVFRDNKELLRVIDWIKSLDGVKDVIWTESVEMLGKNSSMQYEIIDKNL